MFYVALIIGVIGGYILGKLYRPKPVGTLRVDRSDPDDAPQLFLELESMPSRLTHGSIVTFKVNTKSYISHE